MTLRVATAADASSIAALSIEVWVGTYLRHGISAVFADFALAEFTPAKTERLIADRTQFICVSDNAQGIDGVVRLTTGSHAPVAGCSDIEIATLYVQPRHHGKGIGTQLLTAAIARARDIGAPSLWLATNAENMPAISFYLAHGFEQVGETHFRIKDQGYLNNVYRYRVI